MTKGTRLLAGLVGLVVAAGLFPGAAITSAGATTPAPPLITYLTNRELHTVNPETGADTVLTTMPTDWDGFTALTWSPDGHWLALTRKTATNREVVLFNVMSSTRPPIVQLPRTSRPLGWNRAGTSFQFRNGCEVLAVRLKQAQPARSSHQGSCADSGTAGFYGMTAGSSDNTRRRVVSPDGRWSAHLSGRDVLMRRVDGYTRRLQLQDFDGFPSEQEAKYALFVIRWLPNSQSVIFSFTRNPQALDIQGPWQHWIVAATGGSERLLGLRWWLPLSMSWDGSRVAVAGGSEVVAGKRQPTWRLGVYNLVNGKLDAAPGWSKHFHWLGSAVTISPAGDYLFVDNNQPPDTPNPDNGLWVSPTAGLSWLKAVGKYQGYEYRWLPVIGSSPKARKFC